jgi:hypothetical protein
MIANDPRRLFESDDAPAPLRDLLQRAHEDAMPSSVIEQLVQAVEHQAATQASAPVSGRCVSWARRAARGSTKLLLAAAILGAGAWYWSVGKNPNMAERASEQAALAQPFAVHAEPPPVQPAAATGMAVPEAEPSVAADPAVLAGAPTTVEERAGRPLRTPSGLSSENAVSTRSAADLTHREEFRLLRAARQALGTHPERALKLTDEHVRRFAHGMLVQEREAIAIDALVALGKDARARLRAQAFLQSHASSPYRGRVERALAHTTTRP